MHAEDISILVSPGIGDDDVRLVPTYKYRLLSLILRVMPTRSPQLLKKVGGVLPRLRPNEVFRPGKHDMWKVKFSIHSACVAHIEEGGKPIEARRRSPDNLGFRFI